MRSNNLILASLAVLAAATLSACVPEEVPAHPTYDADVYPIMIGRCTRCHSVAGLQSGFIPDPKSSDPLAVINGAFEFYNDPPGCTVRGQPTMCRGLLSYTVPGSTPGPASFLSRVHQDQNAGVLPMPPSPSPMLTKRELEVLDRWFANPIEK